MDPSQATADEAMMGDTYCLSMRWAEGPLRPSVKEKDMTASVVFHAPCLHASEAGGLAFLQAFLLEWASSIIA